MSNGARQAAADAPLDAPFAADPSPSLSPGPKLSALAREEEKAAEFLMLHETAVLRAFRHGVMLVMPLLLAAAAVILVNNFPLAAYQTFMTELFGPGWKRLGEVIYNGTIEILALVVTCTLSDCLVSVDNQERPGEYVPPVVGAMTSLVCLFIMIGPKVDAEGIILAWAGMRGLFASLLITFCACFVFMRLCRIKKLRLSSYSEGADPLLPHMFDTVLPVLGTLFLFAVLRQSLEALGVESLPKSFYEAIRELFADTGDNLGMGALYTLLVQVCWFFGIHGADLLEPITHLVLVRGMELNSLAINSHEPPTYIFTKYFFDVYVYMGGSGTTFGLLAAIFLRSRDNGTRRVAAVSLFPGFFNINELLVFGLPIVLNPAFLLPFVLTPLVLLFISYAAIVLGFAPLPVYQVDWITPPLINAFIATHSWRGVALQLINLTVAILLYIPFVNIADKTKVLNRRKFLSALEDLARTGARGPTGKRCTDRPGGLGALARSLANEMARCLKKKDGSIFLLYQPRVDMVQQDVPCVEALLRWRHPSYGVISPLLTLAVAEDAGLTQELDNAVCHLVFAQQCEWRKNAVFTTVAVNISEGQLRDRGFPFFIKQLHIRYELPAGAILLEVRESLALEPDARYLDVLEALHESGASLAVDDFGKGYRSIAQFKRLPLAEVQIDPALIRDVAENGLSQDVVSSIQEMCLEKGIKSSAAFIESPEQLETLLELNMRTFQGYYFSQPVTAGQCAEFIRKFSRREDAKEG